jgi:hypothetical protein
MQVQGVGEPYGLSDLRDRLEAQKATVTPIGDDGACEVTFPFDETSGFWADDVAMKRLTELRAILEEFPGARISGVQVIEAGDA